MGIEKIVNDERVFEIAEQLTASGVKVTNRAVWSAIGGGSMTTINHALRRWREHQVLHVSQPIERTPLPVTLLDVLHHATAQLWEAAQTETKEELEQLAIATNARVSEAHSGRDEALAELQATVEELEQVKAERDAVLAACDNQAQQLDTLTAELVKLRTDLQVHIAVATDVLNRAETAEAVQAELHARVEQLTGLLAGEQTARQQAQTELTKVIKEKATLDGMLLVYESLGKQPETDKITKTPRKPSAKTKKVDAATQ